MNIRDNKIQRLQMPVCGQLWEGRSVLLAYDAGLTESRAWSVRGQLEVGAELLSDDLLQPVSCLWRCGRISCAAEAYLQWLT